MNKITFKQPPRWFILGAPGLQFVLSFANGFISKHPFGSCNSTMGCILAGIACYLGFLSQGDIPTETYMNWQAYSICGYLSHALAMLFINIYSKGSCESLVEGCDENTSSIAATILLFICCIISAINYYWLETFGIQSYPKRNRFKAVYTTLIMVGVIAWMSGIMSLDGSPFICALGTLCLLGGATTTMVLIFKIRSLLAYPIVLSGEFIISVIILVTGLVRTEEVVNGDSSTMMPLIRSEVLSTQLISMFNLLIGSILMVLVYFRKWEYQQEKGDGLVTSNADGWGQREMSSSEEEFYAQNAKERVSVTLSA